MTSARRTVGVVLTGPGFSRIHSASAIVIPCEVRSLSYAWHRGCSTYSVSDTPACRSPRRVEVCGPLGDRAWGWAARLYATRSAAGWGIGDLGDLRRLGAWSFRLGARILLVNPLSAPIPGVPQQPSPYYPSSRRFRNPLYLSIADVPGAR